MTEVLSQDEIDQLLSAISSGEVEPQEFSGETRQAEPALSRLMEDLRIQALGIPVGVKDLPDLLQSNSVSIEHLVMQPGKRRMEGAAERQSRGSKRLRESIDILELVLQATQQIQVDLAGRKMVHERCFLPMIGGIVG